MFNSHDRNLKEHELLHVKKETTEAGGDSQLLSTFVSNYGTSIPTPIKFTSGNAFLAFHHVPCPM